MSTKTYQSILCQYSGLFIVNGKQQRISFEGSTNNSKGIYTTVNKAEQKAIENSTKFKSGELYLFREYANASDEAPRDLSKTVPVAKAKAEAPAQKTEAPQKEYPGITTVQKAGKALRDDFKVSADSVSNKEKVLAKAKEFNVVFPDLPK